MQPTEIHDWIKSLSINERCDLALQIDRSAGYLNTIATTKQPISTKMAWRIYKSDLNAKLAKSKRLSKKALDKYNEYKMTS